MKQEKNIWEQSRVELFQKLDCRETGLSQEDAADRLAKYGANELHAGKQKSVLQIFLGQFADFLVLILILAAVISACMGDVESMIVILAVITMNAILGTVQTVKASASLDSLKQMSAPTAKVLRDGQIVQIPGREVVPGDVVQAGIMISNSETGLGAVNIQPLIYRLVCSNGMVVNEAGTRRAHIGRVNTTDVNFALYSQQTLDAEDRAFVLKIQDTVRAAVDEARFSTVLDRMRESKQAQLNTQDLPGLVKLASSSFGILEEEGKGVLQHLIEDGDFTLYGLANAVTRFSQDVESYDRATKLEEIGYSVMTMSPLLFQKINQAQVTKLAA